jgi:hypothetical protein
MEAASWLLRDILKLGTQKYLLSKSRIILLSAGNWFGYTGMTAPNITLSVSELK